LVVDEMQASQRGGSITPEICLYSTLRYLAGGDVIGIKNFVGISKASFYRVFEKTSNGGL
jgi:hypothetical protein